METDPLPTAEKSKPRLRWFHLTPDRFVVGLFALEGFLLLSERYQWFAFNEHKGWTVLIALAVVGLTLLLMPLWLAAALLFHWRFQYSLRSLLLLVVAVAIPCSWLGTEIQQARKQKEAVEVITQWGGRCILLSRLHRSPAQRCILLNHFRQSQIGCGFCLE